MLVAQTSSGKMSWYDHLKSDDEGVPVSVAKGVAGALIVLIAMAAPAAESSPELSLSLSGWQSPERMRLKLTLGSGITKAVRVYALPSRKLIGVYSNAEGDVERSEWFRRTFPPDSRPARFPAASFEFEPGSSVTLSTDRPEPSDRAIAIHVYGLWPTPGAPGGVEERDDIFTVHTNPQEFRFRIVRTMNETNLCCGDANYPEGSCKRDCTSCRDNQSLSCCSETDQACGWCGKTVAQCNLCSMC